MNIDPDVNAFISRYIDNFKVNGDYAGDQRDQNLLERIRKVVGDRGDSMVYDALMAGLEETADVPAHYFVRASFILALGRLGDRRAAPILTDLYWKTTYDGYRKDLRQAMSRLGVDGVVGKRMDLEKQARNIIRRKTNASLERFASGAEINLAIELLMRDGGFEVDEEFDEYRRRKLVIRPLSH